MKHSLKATTLLLLTSQVLCAADDVDVRAFSTAHRPEKVQEQQTQGTSGRIAVHQQGEHTYSRPSIQQEEQANANPVEFSYVRDFLDQCTSSANRHVVEQIKTSLIAIEQMIAKADRHDQPVVNQCQKLSEDLSACFHGLQCQVTQARSVLVEFASWLLEYQKQMTDRSDSALVIELLNVSQALIQFLSADVHMAATQSEGALQSVAQNDITPLALNEVEQTEAKIEAEMQQVQAEEGGTNQMQQKPASSWFGSHGSTLGVLGFIAAIVGGIYASRGPSDPNLGGTQGANKDKPTTPETGDGRNGLLDSQPLGSAPRGQKKSTQDSLTELTSPINQPGLGKPKTTSITLPVQTLTMPSIVLESIKQQDIPILTQGLNRNLQALLNSISKSSWTPHVLTDLYRGEDDQYQLLFAFHQNALWRHRLKTLMEDPGYRSSKSSTQSPGGIDPRILLLDSRGLRGFYTDKDVTLEALTRQNKQIQEYVADLCEIQGNAKTLLFSQSFPERLRTKILLLTDKKARNLILGLGSVQQISNFFSLSEEEQKKRFKSSEKDFREAMQESKKNEEKKAFDVYSASLNQNQRKLFDIIGPLVAKHESERFAMQVTTYPVFQVGADPVLVSAVQEMVTLTRCFKTQYEKTRGKTIAPGDRQWAQVDLKTLEGNHVQKTKDRNKEHQGKIATLLELNGKEQLNLLELEKWAPGMNLTDFLSTQWSKEYIKVFGLSEAEIKKFFKQGADIQTRLLKEKDMRSLVNKLKAIS